MADSQDADLQPAGAAVMSVQNRPARSPEAALAPHSLHRTAPLMDITPLLALGSRVGDKLVARGETIAVAESSTGGLISAALLARAGASAYYLGGGVLYTRRAVRRLTALTAADTTGMRSSSPPYAQLLARHQRTRFRSHWALAETGAAGPTGNPYGDPAGHTCLAVDGPVNCEHLLRTGQEDRAHNMLAFAMAALALLEQAIDAAPAPHRAQASQPPGR